MKILVTGCAGFIASYVCEALLARGEAVVGVDEINDYYDVKQKKNNLKLLEKHKGFVFYKKDIRSFKDMKKVFEKEKPDKIIHLAARAGVRPSIDNPFLYEDTNIKGTLSLLELAKECKIKSFVFASSSSVYGNQKKIPFSETDDVDNPISQYAATKKAGELLCYTYHHLYSLKITCLRFFTVYGPRGRPDMAPFKFTKNIIEGKPIQKYGDGKTKRDYTFVADIVKGIVAALDKELDYEIINIGNNKPVELNRFIEIIEQATGRKAIIEQMPMQPGDVDITYADISKAKKLLGYKPQTSIEEGMRKFVEWYSSQKKIENTGGLIAMEKITFGKYEISKKKIFIIAEAGVNHNGDISVAKKLIDFAFDAGVDAVKFQTWKTEELVLPSAEKALYQKETTGAGEGQFDMIKKLELSYPEFKELKKYCDKKGILFLSTPDEPKSAEFLNDLVPLFKIGSGEINNVYYLKYVARFKKPMLIATGTAAMDEVKRAEKWIEEEGNKQAIFLHCTTDYPTPLADVNMAAMNTMRKELHNMVGYSDHTEGIIVPVVAALNEAVVIEKHFTYDKNAPGPDHKASIDPDELKQMVKLIRKIEAMSSPEKEKYKEQIKEYGLIMGSGVKKPSKRALENRKVITKFVVAKTLIKKGTIITEDHLGLYRASANEDDFPAEKFYDVVGKTASQDIRGIINKKMIR